MRNMVWTTTPAQSPILTLSQSINMRHSYEPYIPSTKNQETSFWMTIQICCEHLISMLKHSV